MSSLTLLQGEDPGPLRFESASESIRNAYPGDDLLETVALVITELGEDPAMILILAVAFWLVDWDGIPTPADRREIAALAGYVAAGVAVILIVKAFFSLPRPPEEVWLVERDYDEYGFPSGHAFNAVLLYGGFVYVFDRWRRPAWLGVAFALVVAIAFSRVVLGFHYVGDIIFGATLGLVFLLAMDRLCRRNPVYAFAGATALAVPALVLNPGESLAYIALGAGIGGVLAATRIDSLPPLSSRVEAAILVIGGFAFLIAVVVIHEAIAPDSRVAIVLAHVAIIGGVLLAPLGARQLDELRHSLLTSGES